MRCGFDDIVVTERRDDRERSRPTCGSCGEVHERAERERSVRRHALQNREQPSFSLSDLRHARERSDQGSGWPPCFHDWYERRERMREGQWRIEIGHVEFDRIDDFVMEQRAVGLDDCIECSVEQTSDGHQASAGERMAVRPAPRRSRSRTTCWRSCSRASSTTANSENPRHTRTTSVDLNRTRSLHCLSLPPLGPLTSSSVTCTSRTPK